MQNHFEQMILNMPDQFRPGQNTLLDTNRLRGAKPDALVFCGMGGSGIPATILQNIAEYAIMNLPVVVWKDFGLPRLPYKNPLFVFVSFSGNTAETLSGFALAGKTLPAGRQVRAVVTAGGMLLDKATKGKLPRAVIPPLAIVPRQASGLLLYGILELLQTIVPNLSCPDLSRSIDPATLEPIGKALAKKLKGNNVLIYTSTSENHFASIFKIQLTETSKTPTFCNTYPEINHIEIVGYDRKPKGLVSLFPVTEYEPTITKQLITIEQSVLKQRGITPITISIPGKTPLETAANALVLANWTGYHLAKLNRVDPEKTGTIDEIKTILKKYGLSKQ